MRRAGGEHAARPCARPRQGRSNTPWMLTPYARSRHSLPTVRIDVYASRYTSLHLCSVFSPFNVMSCAHHVGASNEGYPRYRCAERRPGCPHLLVVEAEADDVQWHRTKSRAMRTRMGSRVSGVTSSRTEPTRGDDYLQYGFVLFQDTCTYHICFIYCTG